MDIVLTRSAEKNLQRLPPILQQRAFRVLEALGEGREHGKKLKGGLEGFRSLPVGRSHRVVYAVMKTTIEVRAIRDRKDVYR